MAARRQECSICHDSIKKPTFFPCDHCFCSECLQDRVQGKLFSNGKFNCPMCNKSAELPSEGKRAFQTKETKRQLGQSVHCKKHPKDDIQLVCQTCNVCMCLKCKAFDHDTHPSKLITKVAAKLKDNLLDKRSLCDETLEELNAFVQKGNSLQKRLNKEERSEIDAIENQHLKLLSILGQEATQMKDNVKSQYQKIRERNAVIMNKAHEEIQFYSSAREEASNLIENGTDIETFEQGSELDQRISKPPSSISQVYVNNHGKRIYKPAEINVETLSALIGTTQQEDEVLTHHRSLQTLITHIMEHFQELLVA